MSNPHITRHSRRAKARARREADQAANEPNKLVLAKEAAVRLGCSVEAIFLSAKQGAFPGAKRDGSLLLIPTDDIHALKAKDDRDAT